MTKTKIVIPCGGNGVRLRPLSYYIQKCMIPIPPSEKPLLEHVMMLARLHNFRDFIFLIGHKGEQIKNYFNDGSRFNVKISCIEDRKGVKGSGWALYNAYLQSEISKDDTLFIHFGDILTNLNLSDFISYHKDSMAASTIVTNQGYRLPVGIIEERNGRVTSLIEKPTLEIQVGIGLVIIEGFTLGILESLCKRMTTVDLMRDFLPAIIKSGLKVKAFRSDALWYDVGSLEQYEKLNELPVNKFLEAVSVDKQIN